jgi:hypothetical protein
MAATLAPVARRSTPDPESAELGVLRAILDVQRQILAALERQQRPAVTLNRADRALLAKLLPPIGGVFSSELTLVREMFASEAPAMRVALRGLTPSKVGQLFGRGDGQVIDGYAVQSDGTEENVTLWRVVRVSGVEPSATLAVPRREAGVTR